MVDLYHFADLIFAVVHTHAHYILYNHRLKSYLRIRDWKRACATLVLHWAALTPSSKYIALAKVKRKPFAVICRVLGWTVELFLVKTRLSSVLEMSFVLSEASFVFQIKSQDLMAGFCSSKWLPRGTCKWKFLSPSSKTYLRLATLCTSLHCICTWLVYCIGTFEYHLEKNVTKPNNLERRLTNLVENVKLCLPLLPL